MVPNRITHHISLPAILHKVEFSKNIFHEEIFRNFICNCLKVLANNKRVVLIESVQSMFSKLYKNKLVILNAASFYVSVSPRLPLQTFKHKLSSKVKISCKQNPLRKLFFSKLRCRKFLYKTFSLYILSDNYTTKIMLGTKNVRYRGIFKARKRTC